MSIKKLSFMLLSAFSLAALLNGCGSSAKGGGSAGDVAKVSSEGICYVCHATSVDQKTGTNIIAEYSVSGHNPTLGRSSAAHAPGCQGCHGGGSQHNGVGPIPYANPFNKGDGTPVCVTCHAGAYAMPDTLWAAGGKDFRANCAKCHTASGTGSIHAVQPVENMTQDCVVCHSVAAPNHGTNMVNDNNGVRAITTEFQKWSHHVTGVTLNSAHCAACHLEGKVDGDKIVIDTTHHMADKYTHLRDTTSKTDGDFAWDPTAPNFTGMDTFCLSCHDSDGAVSPVSTQIQDLINEKGLAAAGKTASPTNPFGDTISNQYDKLQRPAVVDAKGQFATANPSHHAVLGKKYTGRTRVAGSRQITSPTTFAANSSATLPGARTTIYDAGKFESAYTTLADAAGESGTRNGGTTLGDDSTLHCADCHTVGQYRAADVGTRYNNAVIGAHGSNNEYLLRNNAGTDARHYGTKFAGTAGYGAAVGYNTTTNKLDGTQAYLVCFNCHAFKTYGSTYAVSGWAGGNHGGEYANQDRCNGPYNTTSVDLTGEARLQSIITNNGGTLGVSSNTFANYQGIQCSNCHNSGISASNIFGGIHGAKQTTYTDGMGNTSKSYRFFPGLGNTMFVPGTKGGFTGGSLATYAQYSGNRNGTGTGATVGQTYSTLPVRTIVPASARVAGATTATSLTRGSYQYTTGGASNDLNWEQQTQQTVSGEFDYQAKSMGCYTLVPTGTVKSLVTTGGAPTVLGTPQVTTAATDAQLGPDGREMFDQWGGCDDHTGAKGAGTGIVRKTLRKVSY